MINQRFKIFELKKGFTLAEVLITLVIIGVIAALTIPTAINNTKDQELKSQFAKAYSTISQALYKTEMNDFYGYARCYYPSNGEAVCDECAKFYSAFEKNLSVQKVCKGNSKADGCIPDYQTYHTATGCKGWGQSNMNNQNYSYVLSNGQIIIAYHNSSFLVPGFLVDINGHKGPNAYGKDLFAFRIKKDDESSIYVNDGLCDFPVSGGRTTKEMIQYALAGVK